MATAIRELMTTDPIVLQSTATAQDAAQKMRQEDVGDVLVEDDGTLRGIVTDRDIVVRVVADGTSPDSVTLGDFCSGDLKTVSPDDELDRTIEMMRSEAIRRVPVVEDGTAIGIVSIGDLAVAKDKESALADISAAPGND